MMLDPDVVADRRRLKRRLGLWRIAAFALGVAAIAAIAARMDLFGDGLDHTRPHVARITVSGLMLPDKPLLDTIATIGKTDAVEGVIVSIDSPGGATSAGEALYEALRGLAAKKPTVAWVGTLAASAGYMTAIGTDHIVARRTALTGSIGVLIQWADVSDLMKTVGVRLEEVKSSPMKAEPNPFKATSPEARAMLDRAVRDTYDWFVAIVAERRGLAPETARALADGRVVTGHQALDLKLVDEIGNEETAVDWLESRGVTPDLPIRDWKPKRPGSGWPFAASLAEAVTRGVMAAFGVTGPVAADGRLDGLTSVWHPEALKVE